VAGRGRWSGARRYAAGSALLLVLALCTGAERSASHYPDPAPLLISGLLGGHPSPALPVSPAGALGASYLPDSNVLRLPDGRLRYVPSGSAEAVTAPPDDPGAAAAAAGTRRWLARGTVPGDNGVERSISARALLDLLMLTHENGAALAAPNPRWDRVWPRDASFVAVAFAATGHHEESYKILAFLARAQEPGGSWEARYAPDGTPVLDGRDRQLDAVGWFPWAVWYWCVTGGERPARLWPATRAAADAAVASLGPDGLPPGGADYWESETWGPNLGTAAPLRTGLRSAADLARRLGHRPEARRYERAAAWLDEAIESEFAPTGYSRTPHPESGADAAITFLAPPFAPPDRQIERAVAAASERLRAPNGGIVPGERWPHDPAVAWTPETALFALSASAGGDAEGADRWLGWLAAHRTSLGAFPEKVDEAGEPQSAAPLAWTEALVVLALAAGEEPLPAPPVAEGPPPRSGVQLPAGGMLLCAGALAFLLAARSRATRPPGHPRPGCGPP
jgi:glucoamylase